MTRAKKKPEPAGLSHASIRKAALALIDRAGIDDFSTRKLGRELGCEAMAIYWYYENKDALLDAVVDELMSGVAAVFSPASEDWIEVLRRVAHAYRQLALAHPRAFPLLATRRLASEETYAFLERIFELGRVHRIDDAVAARFYRVVASYVNGFALNELATRFGPKPPIALRRKFAVFTEVSAFLEPEHLDELFELGLELHLDALAEAAGQSPKKRTTRS
jgi:AcrR family transcriptional regulator